MTQTTEQKRYAQAQKSVSNYTTGSAAIGLILVPALDSALLLAAQVKMIKDLSDLYQIKFSEHTTKSIIASLIGSITPLSLTTNLFSLCKGIPVVGQAVGILGMPVLGGASTFAIGQVFIQHFETGGTLLDFDPQKMKAYYMQQFEEGKKAIKKKNFAGIRP